MWSAYLVSFGSVGFWSVFNRFNDCLKTVNSSPVIEGLLVRCKSVEAFVLQGGPRQVLFQLVHGVLRSSCN